MTLRRARWLALGLVLAGCVSRVHAPDLEADEVQARREQLGPEVMVAFRNLKGRLLKIEHRIRVASAPLCGPLVMPDLGVLVADENTFEQDSVQQLASSALGIHDRATVVHALPTGAFARAGGRVGDAMADAERQSLTAFVMEQVEAAGSAGPITLHLVRDGQPFELLVRPDVACAVRAVFSSQGVLLPWQHDSFMSAIPAGALRYLGDDELAVLIAHQLAHGLLGLAPNPPGDLEAAADRIGLFMVARARFDFSVAPALWERIAAEYPDGIEGWADRHGKIAERLPALQAVVSEIGALSAAGKPLHPGRF